MANKAKTTVDLSKLSKRQLLQDIWELRRVILGLTTFTENYGEKGPCWCSDWYNDLIEPNHDRICVRAKKILAKTNYS
ncbi:MAG: hypothetical protein UY40_C0001G0011 [candidate division CPR1 bacterium GW2011_GWC1_49_13]|uniref:Uncharacterized protein n=1 Tax=candidate division CPR1 bacterium GW2011_GWC1_49_13 TaxID=1618342 RepID=A0A0G1VI99_9BACT|nr:MAG: hypothetical protein UY40_C0001G0011 [candidate division CPR1 bacterium GW2011_GWC1_49_13]